MKRNTEYTNLNVFACIASTVAMFLFIKFEELMQQSMDFTIVFCTRESCFYQLRKLISWAGITLAG